METKAGKLSGPMIGKKVTCLGLLWFVYWCSYTGMDVIFLHGSMIYLFYEIDYFKICFMYFFIIHTSMVLFSENMEQVVRFDADCAQTRSCLARFSPVLG